MLRRLATIMTIFPILFAASAHAINRDYFIGAYVRPLPLLYDEISGAKGLGAGVEIRTWRNLFVTSAFDHVEAGLNEPTSFSISELRTHVGLNLYSERRTDSAFVALAWSQERLRSSSVGRERQTIGEWQSAGLSGSFGYRWLWQEGLLIKAGLNIGQRSSSRTEYEDSSSSLSLQEQQKYEQTLQRVNAVNPSRTKAGLEFGIGWSF